MSAILKQLEEHQEAARISAEWNDLVSVEELAEKTRKTIEHVKDMLAEIKINPKGKFGKSYMYSKAEILQHMKDNIFFQSDIDEVQTEPKKKRRNLKAERIEKFGAFYENMRRKKKK